MRSSVCREVDFQSSWYRKWREILHQGARDLQAHEHGVSGKVWESMKGDFMHRKVWEWCAIAEALEERGMLHPGSKGLGFAVGTEPLPSLFAGLGCTITATDCPEAARSAGWRNTGQLSCSVGDLHWPKIVDRGLFERSVEFQTADMRDLTTIEPGAYDFLWSACAFEHLGSLQAGTTFVVDSLACLRPGGIAVHTTEFNVGSNAETIQSGDSVIYRRRDLEALDRDLRRHGAAIEDLDFEAGAGAADIDYDYPPYYSHGRQHVKLLLGGHISTSIVLIVRKGSAPSPSCVSEAPHRSLRLRLAAVWAAVRGVLE